MYKIASALFVAAAAVTAVGVAVPAPGPDRAAYFKSADRDRVLVLVGDLAPAAARAALDGQPWSEGRRTTAYLYRHEVAGAAAVTLAPDFATADRLARGGHYCALTVAPTGARAIRGDCA